MSDFVCEKQDQKAIISIEEYRKIVSDRKTVDKAVAERLKYLEALCRNIIKSEITNYNEKEIKKEHIKRR